MSERPVITVTGKMPNMQSWYEEKCKRALEELSLLADTIHRPGNEPKRGWPSKQEEIDTHLFNAIRAVLIVTNTWNIVMGVFDAAQSVVGSASGIISGDTNIDISTVMTDLETTLMAMEIGPLLGLWFQSLFAGICTWAIAICIFIITYGRMIEIYLVTSLAPIPMATMMGKEWGGMGQNYLRALFALGFQAFLIIVCVAIYAVLVQSISVAADISSAIWTCMGYTVLLCFCLFKTSSLAKSIFNAH